MSQQTPSSSWGVRPSKKKIEAVPAAVATLDKFVNGGQEETVRLNVEIPKALRARVKARCAIEGREIKDVVTELLRQRFPE
ncbi:MAG: hypothetical protein ABSD98_08320 [Candidatus Korobacteraceae bacterium]|jgi:hypothetical protein